MALLNCLLSAWYGLPFVSTDNILVSTVNGAGAAIEAVYVVIFLVFASKPSVRAHMAALLAAVLSAFAAVAVISLALLDGRPRKLLCGFAAAAFSICMYASPLPILRLEIKTKSVKYMPFLLSLFVFLCGTSWFVYGLLGHDPSLHLRDYDMIPSEFCNFPKCSIDFIRKHCAIALFRCRMAVEACWGQCSCCCMPSTGRAAASQTRNIEAEHQSRELMEQRKIEFRSITGSLTIPMDKIHCRKH